MQISGASNLTWLQSVGLTTPSSPAPSAAGQISSDDAAGAEASSSPLSSLQSPCQQFSATNLGALIAAQTAQPTEGSSSASAQPPHGISHHHPYRTAKGDVADIPSALSSTPTGDETAAATSSPSSTDNSSMMSELLATL